MSQRSFCGVGCAGAWAQKEAKCVELRRRSVLSADACWIAGRCTSRWIGSQTCWHALLRSSSSSQTTQRRPGLRIQVRELCKKHRNAVTKVSCG